MLIYSRLCMWEERRVGEVCRMRWKWSNYSTISECMRIKTADDTWYRGGGGCTIARGGARRWSHRSAVEMCTLLFSNRRRHKGFKWGWSSDVCSSFFKQKTAYEIQV